MAARKPLLRAITFDAGGTWLHPWPSVGAIYAEVATAWTGRHFSARDLTRRFQEAWRARPDFDHSRARWMEVVDAVFAGLLPVPPSRTFFGELYERFRHPDVWRVDPAFPRLLMRLRRRGVKLGLISNWDLRLRPLLRALRLESGFDVIVVSAEIGFAKPSPSIFLHAADALGLPPDQILHVGDEPVADVEAARRAGFQAVLLGRRPQSSAPHAIRSLRQLEPWLRRAGFQWPASRSGP
ncbi:HAD-IA family hydrolase [Limisphaera sp. VF-2]|uniref:HAD-IA family hydrolase n=1 Tax=Limisphaera sp. VF-2 TaxID=3400418 RepID=UPI0025649E26|nr:HAD-IA family hydrolase [Limisphaera sp.]